MSQPALRGLAVQTALPGDLALVEFDAVLMERVLVNLLENAARYGAPSNTAFVQTLYQNTLDRPGDAGGVAYWTGQLDAGALTRPGAVVGFSESQEHVVRTASLFGGEDPATYGIALAA